jgi:hypothetical protein
MHERTTWMKPEPFCRWDTNLRVGNVTLCRTFSEGKKKYQRDEPAAETEFFCLSDITSSHPLVKPPMKFRTFHSNEGRGLEG